MLLFLIGNAYCLDAKHHQEGRHYRNSDLRNFNEKHNKKQTSKITKHAANNVQDSIDKIKKIETDKTKEIDKKKNKQSKMESIGFCKVTGYSYNDDGGSVNYYTSTGAKPVPYKTCAVDPNTIAYGTKLYIPDLGLKLVAEDCGGAVSGNHIDVHVGYDNSDEVIGNSYHKVYVLN